MGKHSRPHPLRVSGAKLRVLMLTRLYLLGWYWCGELGSTLEKLLSAAMVSILTQPSLLSFSVLDGWTQDTQEEWKKISKKKQTRNLCLTEADGLEAEKKYRDLRDKK